VNLKRLKLTLPDDKLKDGLKEAVNASNQSDIPGLKTAIGRDRLAIGHGYKIK